MKKFELTTEFKMFCGRKLFRIRALIAFGNVKAGELGGCIEREENLNQSGNAWVSGNARVYGNAWVSGNANYTTIKGFGSAFRNTTFFRQADNTIGVVCGCFYGTLEEFRNKVSETHGDTKYAKEYLMIADLMEIHFANEKELNQETGDEHKPTLMNGLQVEGNHAAGD